MIGSDWIFDVSSIVFTNIEYKVKKKLIGTYPNISFTTSNMNKITKFPTVYFHEITGNEVGKDLANDEVNGISAAYQVEIYSDKDQETCRKVAKEVVKVMKSLHFSTTTPVFQNESTTYRLILRFNRFIGSEDIM